MSETMADVREKISLFKKSAAEPRPMKRPLVSTANPKSTKILKISFPIQDERPGISLNAVAAADSSEKVLSLEVRQLSPPPSDEDIGSQMLRNEYSQFADQIIDKPSTLSSPSLPFSSAAPDPLLNESILRAILPEEEEILMMPTPSPSTNAGVAPPRPGNQVKFPYLSSSSFGYSSDEGLGDSLSTSTLSSDEGRDEVMVTRSATQKRTSSVDAPVPVSHSKSKYYCDLCSRSFSNRALYQNHLEIHEGLKPFPCPLCERGYETEIKLVEHFARHSNDGIFVCGECRKAYKTQRGLNNHRERVCQREEQD